MARGSVAKRCPCKLPKGQACRRPHGTWTVRVDVGGRPGSRRQIRRSGFASRNEAEAELSAILTGVDSGAWVDDRGMTLAQWLTQWLTSLRDLEPKTLANYAGHVTDVWEPELGVVLLRDLRRHHVEAVLTKLGEPTGRPQLGVGRGRRVDVRAPATIEGYRRTLRAALTEAKIHGLITVNVAEGRMRSIPQRRPAPPTTWEPEQTARFLEAASAHPLSVAYELAAYTGMRRGELCGLRWCDIEADSTALTIRQTYQEVARRRIPDTERVCLYCGREHRGLYRKAPKSLRGHRVIPLVQPAQVALALHREAQRAERRSTSDWDDHGGLVLTDPRQPGWPLRPSALTKAHHQMAAAAGLPAARLHDVRHATASLLVSSGVPIEVVAKVLGHDPEVTRRTYAHLLRGETARQMDEAMMLVSRHRRAHSVPTQSASDAYDAGR
jgi:integrase